MTNISEGGGDNFDPSNTNVHHHQEENGNKKQDAYSSLPIRERKKIMSMDNKNDEVSEPRIVKNLTGRLVNRDSKLPDNLTKHDEMSKFATTIDRNDPD